MLLFVEERWNLETAIKFFLFNDNFRILTDEGLTYPPDISFHISNII